MSRDNIPKMWLIAAVPRKVGHHTHNGQSNIVRQSHVPRDTKVDKRADNSGITCNTSTGFYKPRLVHRSQRRYHACHKVRHLHFGKEKFHVKKLCRKRRKLKVYFSIVIKTLDSLKMPYNFIFEKKNLCNLIT